MLFIQTIVVLTVLLVHQMNGDPEVQLPNGRIRGGIGVTAQNTTYFVFAKIPYATPPLGTLRFQPTQPASNWEGVLDATKINVSCWQQTSNVTSIESEDCLFINVVVPQLETNEPLPVLFFIHRGSFTFDSSIKYLNSDGITDNGVILVTFNYRLGVFGFLSTEDNVISGNAGLKDQKLALEWTHQNIALFGGDPTKITIHGQSAGAMCVGYHLLNNGGLFRGAILESGSALTLMGYQRDARQRAFHFASLINPTFTINNNSTQLLNYLQSVDPKTLRDTSSDLFNAALLTNPSLDFVQGKFWAPVLEENRQGAFVMDEPYQQLLNGNPAKVPILIGYNSEETVAFANLGVLQNVILLYFDVRVDLLVPPNLPVSWDQTLWMGTTIKQIYLQDHFADLLALHPCDGIRFLSDTIFTRSVLRFAEMYSKVANTYLYEFGYDGTLGNVVADCPGVGHSEDLNYLFCSYPECDITEYSEEDQITQRRLSLLWSNFAKTLNPTPESSTLLQNVTWPKVSRGLGDFEYLNINTNLEVKNHPKNDTYPEWVKLYSSVADQNLDTY